MSDNPSFTIGSVPETSSPLFLAIRQIAAASSEAEIVTAVRNQLIPDADRVSLIEVDTAAANKKVCRSVAVWDRDDLELGVEFPLKVHELVQSQPLVVVDTIYLDESLAPLKEYMVDSLKATSFAIFPLVRHDHPIGYLEIVTRHTGLNDDAQVRALLMACWQISIALENLILSSSLDNAKKRFGATSAVLRAIAGAKQKAALAEAVTQTVQKVLPITHLSVALQQEETAEVDIVTWHGPELSVQTTFNGSLIQQALKSKQAVLLDGLYSSTVDEEKREANKELQKLIIAPMISGEYAVGTLNFGFGGGMALTTEDRRLAEEIAGYLAATYSQLRLMENLQQSLEETTTLYSTSLAMNAAQNLEEIYTTLLSETSTISGADRIIVYLAGPDPRDSLDYVEVAAVWKSGKMQAAKGQLRYPLAQAPVLSQFPQSRSNLIFNDVVNDMRLDQDLRNFYAEEKVNSLMLVPLSTGAIWLGAILIEANQGQTFTNEQARLSRSLADQAALALDSQLLLLRRDQVIGRERALREITERIRQAHSVEDILAITSEELSKVTGINPEKLKSFDLSDSVRFHLSREERDYITSVQNQVQLAIDNVQLIETTREAAGNEQALRDIASALNSTLDLDRVLRLILDNVGRVLPHDAANIQVIHNGIVRHQALRGYAERGLGEAALWATHFMLDDTPNLKQMAETRRPVVVADTHSQANWIKTPETEWIRSYIGAPIYVEDQMIGFLNLDSATPNLYNDSYTERLQAFANQAAIAIRNARAYQSTRLQAEVIGNVTANLQGAVGVDDVLETAVRTLSGTLDGYDVQLRLTAQSEPMVKVRRAEPMGDEDNPAQESG